MHAWVHYYPTPGESHDMHCHNADQTFYVIKGECTMHFPDGAKAVMKPGMAATITGDLSTSWKTAVMAQIHDGKSLRALGSHPAHRL
jgi:uncharacterized cupin superfamily protein